MIDRTQGLPHGATATPGLKSPSLIRLHAFVTLGGLAIIAVIWIGLAYHLRLREAVVREQAHRDVGNLSALLEQQVERLMIGADQVMQFIADDLKHNPEAFDPGAWMRRAISLDDVVHQLTISDEKGDVIASRATPSSSQSRLNVADRAYFQALKAHPDLGLYVDRTLQGRITGQRAIQTARRLDRRDGSFAGVVVASIDPTYLSRQFETLDVGRGGSVALFGQDGYIRARYPQIEGMYDLDMTTIPTGKGAFAHLRESPSGTYEVESALDHTTRIFGYRQFDAFPLVVALGKSLEEVMAPLQAERRRARLAGLGATALMLLVMLVLLRELRHRHQHILAMAAANLALAEKEEAAHELNRLHAMAEHIARVGHWYVRPGDPVHHWSDEMYRIHDVGRSSFVPSAETLLPMIHPEDAARASIWWKRVFEDHHDVDDGEFRMVLPSGRMIVVLTRNRVERDESGRIRMIFGAVMDVTERCAAEAAVSRSAALLSRTLDCMDQGLIMVNAEQIVQVCNRRAAELLEVTQEFVGKGPNYRIFRAQARKAKRWGELVSDTPLSLSAEDSSGGEARTERRTADGQVLEIRTIRTHGGGMIQTFTDITEQRRAEDRYKLLAENANDLIVLKPAFMGRRSFVAPASRLIVGWEPEELAIFPTDQFVHPDDFSRVAADYASLSPRTPRVTNSHRIRHKAGHYIWVETTFHLTRAGQPDEVVIVTARDITARRAAEDALRESEARHRLLAEATTDIISHVDMDGTLRYVSPAAEAAIGYDADSLVGRKAIEFLNPDDRDGFIAYFRALVAAGPGARNRFEYRVIHRNGSLVWFEVNPTVLFDAASGQPTGYIDVARDVTSRKTIEAELEAARIAAEQASQAKTEFLASMSHEIRTPLNGIIGYTELMLDDNTLNIGQRRRVERIQSAGSALLTVVNDILDFSKIEAGEIDLDPMPFYLRALLDNAASIVRGFAERKGLVLRLDAGPAASFRLVGDQNRLRQILLNFLNNAIKFTAHGQVALAVACAERGDAAVCRIRFAVTDTGIGIPENRRHRLFERFSQVDSSVQREFGGTGLGLAISKRLVELMGGTIGVESVEGDGSTFWFEVDLPVVGEDREHFVGSEIPARELCERSAHILLVEDVEINQEIACIVLRGFGHTIDVVGDGVQAIAAVRSKRYDLVLMDIQMPGMDGMTATRHIRSLAPPTCDVPIVAMTANVLPGQVLACRAAGMNDHVGKPFSRKDLQAAIERCTAAETTRGAAVSTHFPSHAGESAVDWVIYGSMVDAIGHSRMLDLLGRLAGDIVDSLSDHHLKGGNQNDLASDAHTLISSAGLLGFAELSKRCRELETVCKQGGELTELVPQVRSARQRALKEIENLRSAA